jgi:broad specificity phosphatase PhoE
MGKQFEGNPITSQSLLWSQWYVRHPFIAPEHGGEPWQKWYDEWMHFLAHIDHTGSKIGVVTHNRNIQAVYATVDGKFQERLYNVSGPNFCTVHVYREGHAEPWDGKELKPGIYLIRHGETAWGT